MRVTRRASGWKWIPAVVVVFFAVALSAQETVLHSFNDTDGNFPSAPVILDSAGNLYGTTFYGGTYTSGTVYKLTHSSSGWSESVLYSFNNNGTDGYFTHAAVVLDKSGNVYGTTFLGGVADGGTVFELSPSAGGWTETILHEFANDGIDGVFPQAAVTLDGAGNIYGTTSNGGTYNAGTVFELSPSNSGWTEKILYNFGASSTDGTGPLGTVVFDTKGNLYGTTSAGGGTSLHCRFGCGTVFELSPSAGEWTETIIHNFNDNPLDGSQPDSGLIFDKAGNLYGTALQGGKRGNNGTVFELLPTAGGLWREKILHSFMNNGKDGRYSMATPVLDAAGNLYCTTENGGAYGQGTVFKLTPRTTGAWEETVLYSFDSSGSNGWDPAYGLAIDSAGNLYGTTVNGGTYTYGTVFEITQ